jgi:hypothetical protein
MIMMVYLTTGFFSNERKKYFLGRQTREGLRPFLKTALEAAGFGKSRFLDSLCDFQARDPLIAATNDHFLFVRGMDESGEVVFIDPNGAGDMALVKNVPCSYVDDGGLLLLDMLFCFLGGNGTYFSTG